MSEQLQGRELDAKLHKALGHEVRREHNGIYKSDDWYSLDAESDMWMPVPNYHDLNAMHEVEAEIERRGMQTAYTNALLDTYPRSDDRLSSWLLTHATAEQRVRAALAVLTTQGG